eukprot:gene12193-25611_t
MINIHQDSENALRAILSTDGVIGRKTRWWTGSKNFDFQVTAQEDSDHKKEENENYENIKERNERLISELCAPNIYDTECKTDIEFVERGLSYILSLALEKENFENFGSDAFLTFYDVATTAEEPLRKFALLRTEITAQMWLQHYPSLAPNTDDENENDSSHSKHSKKHQPTADEVLDFIMGIYALERVGIGHDSKEEVRTAASKYSTEDFFDISPKYFDKSRGLHSSERIECRDFTQVLTYSFYAEKTGINIQIKQSDILRTLPLYRPYKMYKLSNKDDEKFDEFADQLTMIFNIIHILSNYGELRLSSNLLPQETLFLSNKDILNLCIEFNDIHLIGEIIHCLRVLGTPDTDEIMQIGLNYLRSKQDKNGSWPARDDSSDAYFKYHATMCAISALNPQRFRGFGPSDPLLYQQLKDEALLTKTKDSHTSSSSSAATLGTPSFCTATIPSLSSYSPLEQLYSYKTMNIMNEIYIDMEEYGNKRLQLLLAAKEEAYGQQRQRGKGERASFIVAGQRSSSSTTTSSRSGNNSSKSNGKRKFESDDDKEWRPS